MDTSELQKIKNRFNIIGNDAALNRAIETAMAVAPTDLSVLVSGESGVGKEVIPRIIHQNSLRRGGKYFAINCGGIPEGTINSELFGHEKGSFTGAVGERKGYFEEADGGTLFLDEIGELPMATQAMLLRVLQDGEFMKVGSSKVEKTDVRIIAATNVNLEYAVSKGKFRADLYYRLCGITIRVPALRERKDDIYLLFRKFAADYSEKYHATRVGLTRDAIIALSNYRWPGNVRQLKNVTDAICVMESSPVTAFSERREINSEALAKYLPKESGETLPVPVSGSQGQMNDDEKQFLISSVLTLKQNLDALSGTVLGLRKELDAVKGLGFRARIAAPGHQETFGEDKEEPDLQEEYDDQSERIRRDIQFDGQPERIHGDIQFDSQPGRNREDVRFEDRTEKARQSINISAHHEREEDDLNVQHATDRLYRAALEKYPRNRKRAAEELGVSERSLYRWIKDNDYKG